MIMNEYQHTQAGWVLMGAFGFCLGLFLALGMIGKASDIVIVVPLLFLVLLALFHSLNVAVTKEEISLRFGIGFIKKKIAVTDIRTASVVRNRWYYGFGIRFTPHGWLYNVSGLNAVEIELAKGKNIRIGTNEPGELLAAIESVIGKTD